MGAKGCESGWTWEKLIKRSSDCDSRDALGEGVTLEKLKSVTCPVDKINKVNSEFNFSQEYDKMGCL